MHQIQSVVSNWSRGNHVIGQVESKLEADARIALAAAMMALLKLIWKDKKYTIKNKLRLLHLLSVLYVGGSWTLMAGLQRLIQAVEMRWMST